jgi:hypothetical protein
MDLLQAVGLSLLYGLADPLVFLPALVIGWLARAWWQAAAGAALIAVILFAIELATPLPEGSSRVWAVVPLMVIAPLVWTSLAYRLRRWLKVRRHVTPADPVACAVLAVIGGVVGACVGGLAGVALGTLYIQAAEVSNFEGAAGYMVVFLFMLPGIVIGAVAGAILTWRRAMQRSSAGSLP